MFSLTSSARAQRVERDVAYGTDSLQRLDLFLPAGRGFATVLFVHGGSLTSGDKRDDDYRAVCAPIVAAGFACASMNYRLGPAHRWPAPAEDVVAAVAWLHDSVAARGGDAAKIVLLGHSSGAALAALVATDERYLAARGLGSAAVRGAIAMGSIMWDEDLAEAIRSRGRDTVAARWSRSPASEMFATLAAYEDYWPIRHVRRGQPPILFLIAEAEQEHPPVLSTDRRFVDEARALGNVAEYRVLPGRTHYSAIRRLGEPGDPALAAITEFVRRVAAR